MNDMQTRKPTISILILLTGIYSWILSAALHLRGVVAVANISPTKYYVTLAISVCTAGFMAFYGKRVVRESFGAMGGRDLEISGRQAIYITMFVVSWGVYTTWLLS